MKPQEPQLNDGKEFKFTVIFRKLHKKETKPETSKECPDYPCWLLGTPDILGVLFHLPLA